ncbi:hypothetical protein H0H81_005360 [Sphagnurus paluster]|uniref:Protein N-terminal glutamine amidohydrolase alpha beta roll domain-containing protein n=1 Tax=Sphagnurus paluster TaxID=117069 RepID=A0A9P7GM59_9AGAR|nr:hypothetical protein H0H81_005360 [Sphagnurus paluster]
MTSIPNSSCRALTNIISMKLFTKFRQSTRGKQLWIVPDNIFLEQFASDRSHMIQIDSDGSSGELERTKKVYNSPPPTYDPIRGDAAVNKGIENNLMSSFVSMVPSPETYGVVVDRNGFREAALKTGGVTHSHALL